MIRHQLRAVRWQPVLPPVLLAALLLAWRRDDLDGPAALMLLRAAAALLALGTVFALDDPAAPVLACSPTPLWRRRALALAVVLLPTAAAWAGLLAFAESRGAAVPVGALCLEFGALLALGAAGAGALQRLRGVLEPGALVSPLLAVAMLGAMRLPERWALLAFPGPGWDDAHARWAVLLAVAAAVLLAALRDPARRLRRAPTRMYRPRRSRLVGRPPEPGRCSR